MAKRQISDGWHEMGYYAVYTEGGRVTHATKDNHQLPAAPYCASPEGGWDNATGVKYETFRRGFREGRYIIS